MPEPKKEAAEAKKVPEIDEVEGFYKAVSFQDPRPETKYLRRGELHCPKCGDTRRMDMSLKYRESPGSQKPPILAVFQCGECDSVFTAMLYSGPEGPGLVVIPETHGGLTTPHTPNAVGYYLDQAQRAHAVGANSAAVAMFRGALEHLLFQQGFKDGMCGKKINDLEAAIKNKTAPKWAYELDTEFLTVMKMLGDGSIHPNDGDIAHQAKLDTDLIVKLRHTFQMLLFLIYEIPLQKQERLQAMRAAVIKK